MNIQDRCAEVYARVRNLKLTGLEVGIPWQTAYVHLKNKGVKVIGDKARYGSASDRVGIIGELLFKQAVPFAINNNETEFQSSIDFLVNKSTVDVKASRIHPAKKNSKGKSPAERWSFCINKQRDTADYFVLYALNDNDQPLYVFLIPCEVATAKTTISIPTTMASKWADFLIPESELSAFFSSIN